MRFIIIILETAKPSMGLSSQVAKRQIRSGGKKCGWTQMDMNSDVLRQISRFSPASTLLYLRTTLMIQTLHALKLKTPAPSTLPFRRCTLET